MTPEVDVHLRQCCSAVATPVPEDAKRFTVYCTQTKKFPFSLTVQHHHLPPSLTRRQPPHPKPQSLNCTLPITQHIHATYCLSRFQVSFSTPLYQFSTMRRWQLRVVDFCTSQLELATFFAPDVRRSCVYVRDRPGSRLCPELVDSQRQLSVN